jgi:hypothetical protein
MLKYLSAKMNGEEVPLDQVPEMLRPTPRPAPQRGVKPDLTAPTAPEQEPPALEPERPPTPPPGMPPLLYKQLKIRRPSRFDDR